MTYQAAQAIAATANPQAVIDRPALTRAVEIVTDTIERRNTVPILSNLRLQGEGDRFFITGTDLDIEITAMIGGAADSRFDTTIPAHGLKDYLKKARKSEYAALTHIADDLEHGTVDLEFDAVRYQIQALDATDFPVMIAPAHNELHKFTLSGGTFQMAINGTIDAISTETVRSYLCGTYMHCHDDSLRFVATDGHRLFMQEIAKPDWLSEAMPGVIIPRKTIKFLNKWTKGKHQPEAIEIEVTETKFRASFMTPDGIAITVTSKVIDGTFPDYHRVIPHNEFKAVVNADDLAGATTDVSLISSERGRAVKFSVYEHEIELSVNNPDQGRANATIKAECDCDGIEIGFNYKYIADILSEIEGKQVTMYLQDSGSPTIFTGSREGWKAVLMPMRV